jgi:hypothetical protein
LTTGRLRAAFFIGAELAAFRAAIRATPRRAAAEEFV